MLQTMQQFIFLKYRAKLIGKMNRQLYRIDDDGVDGNVVSVEEQQQHDMMIAITEEMRTLIRDSVAKVTHLCVICCNCNV
jgi:putative ribosome biogenesis GTPase RsgA